ncbi:hypothetical protein CB0940_07516 [Cercospora beticola]|uniref:Zn(2)-C6 fungal-type domain-containing protein n=1 Tax=Cercospora beticola TaxID=122368 RepID=A0A2G5H9J8_CERBT|nr:hypothetical protein CB0940_07516 [Cercospora beticola]PIA89218.1 hypothetical protein CB0940_07516 [Cercospora beticola]WPB03475.1 hypothetical protein RHO25_008114 [Cercospora beticola]
MSSSSSWAGYGPTAPAPAQAPPTQLQRSGSGDRQKKPQSRQLLSCTKCRERKVKCDRTKPCSACCARGHPKECEFVVGEGNDYSPIQQSYEIRKLRAENQRLKEKLQAARLTQSGEDEDDEDSSDRKVSKGSARAAASRQRRFRTGDRVDNLYFGTPGLTNIVADFANLQLGTQSLTHTIPRGKDIYTHDGQQSIYPFMNLWGGGSGAKDMARDLLASPDEVYSCLDMFEKRAQSCYFPQTPDLLTRREVSRFLERTEDNAEAHPDMLALIFAMVATAMQMGVYDRHGEWAEGAVDESRRRSDVYIAAAMQALRLASFMNTPTLLAIQTLVMIGPYLTNSGRFLDAWTLFGTTIRLAHSIGLHRDPKALDATPPLRESMIRRTLWWWMLHMDQQYSVTLGRPLGISGIGDCQPPEPLTTNPTILRLNEFVDHFTILGRQILSSDGMMNVGRIDEYTDKLLGLWDTMPEALQFNETWLQQETSLPDWPLEVMSAMLYAKVQSFLILLNRQRLEKTQGAHTESSSPGSMLPPRRPQPIMTSSMYGDQPLHPAPLRGRSLVINSSIALINAFMFFHYRRPQVLICWTMGQQCFNACMILILDALETDNENNLWLVNQAFAVFHELDKKGVHKLADLAVARISLGLSVLHERQNQRKQQQAATRGASAYHPQLEIDTASMTDFQNDSVMGNTGMFLLEDTGLQSFDPMAFAPLGWNMAGSANTSHTSNPTTPNIPSPMIPVSQVTAAPFPVVTAPPYTTNGMMAGTYMTHVSPQMHPQQSIQYHRPGSSSSVGRGQVAFTPINTNFPLQQQPILQPHHPHRQQLSPVEQAVVQQSFSQIRGPRHSHHHSSAQSSHHKSSSHKTGSGSNKHISSSGSSGHQHHGIGAGPRGIHRSERGPKSSQRRK